MGYHDICFFQSHVTLQPCAPCCTCSSHQHAYGSPSEAQLDGPLCLPLKVFKSKLARVAPPKLPEPQVHFIHVASLLTSGLQGVGRIWDAMWELGLWC